MQFMYSPDESGLHAALGAFFRYGRGCVVSSRKVNFRYVPVAIGAAVAARKFNGFHTNHEVMNMINKINNDELPIGFTMELAMHSDALNRFAGLSKPEQEKIVNGARTIESRQEMRNYVENMFTKG